MLNPTIDPLPVRLQGTAGHYRLPMRESMELGAAVHRAEIGIRNPGSHVVITTIRRSESQVGIRREVTRWQSHVNKDLQRRLRDFPTDKTQSLWLDEM